jgi:hypothetical protein
MEREYILLTRMTMDLSRWLAMPQQVDAQVERWQRDFPDLFTVDYLTQYTGHRCLALTVAEKASADDAKAAAWFCVPHAHEPAGTAAIMDFIQQLLTGRDLAGQPAQFDYAAARRKLILTFNPDANPGGRTWSPCVWWDGTKYTNDEFWTWMRGLDPHSGGMWKRVARWSLREEHPLRRGIVYEQLDAHQFVEPNRDPGSSLVRLFRQMNARYQFKRAMHLHQTEFERATNNCMINLPVLQPELPPHIQQANEAWGQAVLERWRAMGADPVPSPRSFPYNSDTQTVGWFRDCWGESQHAAPEIVVEVQNNNRRTPPEAQLALELAAIQVTVEQLLAEAL